MITEKIKEFLKEEQDMQKKLKNLIIKCIRESFVEAENIKENNKYTIWSISAGTLTNEGDTEILKIEKEIKDYGVAVELTEYTIYGKSGLIVRSGLTKITLEKELESQFIELIIKYPQYYTSINIISYLYSGKSVETADYLSWEDAKK